MARQGLLFQHRLHLRTQATEAATHIRYACCDPDPRSRRKRNHTPRPFNTARIIAGSTCPSRLISARPGNSIRIVPGGAGTGAAGNCSTAAGSSVTAPAAMSSHSRESQADRSHAASASQTPGLRSHHARGPPAPPMRPATASLPQSTDAPAHWTATHPSPRQLTARLNLHAVMLNPDEQHVQAAQTGRLR